MNKIYSDPIEKAQALIDGVKKMNGVLREKGVNVDVDKLQLLSSALLEDGQAQEAAEEQLRLVREKAHASLSELKDVYTSIKTPIKQMFPQEEWLAFGIMDKK